MPNKVENIIIDQGSDFSYSFKILDNNGDPEDLSNHTANAVIKWYYTHSNNIPLTCNVSNGLIMISLTSNQTSNLSFYNNRALYDIKLHDSNANTSIRIREGVCFINKSVTT